ncbi:MAG: GTPase domain-containing protein [Deltaproteobacteria bacterium]|nr:GTPase domain-containing protein [Deltaproteobacteria bacterium]
MTQFRVIYVGASLSGRCVSTSEVLRFAGKHDSSRWTGREEYELAFVDRDIRNELVVSISHARAQRFSYDPTSSELQPEIAEEISGLERADGIVFVIDGQIERWHANLHEFEKLQRDLRSRGMDASKKPTVFQINKRDLPSYAWTEEMARHFYADRCAYVETCAERGDEAIEAFRTLVRMIRD